MAKLLTYHEIMMQYCPALVWDEDKLSFPLCLPAQNGSFLRMGDRSLSSIAGPPWAGGKAGCVGKVCDTNQCLRLAKQSKEEDSHKQTTDSSPSASI